MKTLSLKLDDALYARVLAMAKQCGATQSDVVRDAILARLEPSRGKLAGSALDLAKDLAGCITGPPDLSANKAYLRGFGR
jgi:predicted transcriptional regulator